MTENKKKIRVAVFPAGTEIGLEIYHALKYEKTVELYGLTSISDHSQMVYKNIFQVPFYYEKNFIGRLNGLIHEHRIDFIYPAYDDVLIFLTRRRREIDAEIVASPPETIEITRSKRKTYACFAAEDFVPEMYSQLEEITYPVFVKPDIGQGSEGARLVHSAGELQTLDHKEKMIFSEYLPGEELSVDCFTDAGGRLLSCVPRKRLRIRNGIAVKSELTEITEEIADIAHTLNRKLHFCGAWFYQLKKDASGKYKLLEIAARIAGTMGLTRNLGLNYPMLTLYIKMGVPVSVCKNDFRITVDRALISRYETDLTYKAVYVDLDDTLIINGRVHLLLMQYLYQCVNEGVKLFLLSRHRGDIAIYLKAYKISEILFDEIFSIGEEPKSKYIMEQSAIFIDDSYRERKEVQETCGIPVFGPENVESLMKWRR